MGGISGFIHNWYIIEVFFFHIWDTWQLVNPSLESLYDTCKRLRHGQIDGESSWYLQKYKWFSFGFILKGLLKAPQTSSAGATNFTCFSEPSADFCSFDFHNLALFLKTSANFRFHNSRTTLLTHSVAAYSTQPLEPCHVSHQPHSARASCPRYETISRLESGVSRLKISSPVHALPWRVLCHWPLWRRSLSLGGFGFFLKGNCFSLS